MQGMKIPRSCPRPTRAPQRGFTLIELMIVVAVIAVLSLIALPGYQDSVRKSRRSEAVAALSAVQQAQERWRANNPAYAASAALTVAPPAGLGLAATTSNGHYAIAISGAASASYTVTATAQGAQVADKARGVTCSPLTVTVTNGSGDNAPAECWSR